jgi:hypothetical protein
MNADQGKTAAKAEKTTHCSRCEQHVKPVEHNGWRNFFAWLTLVEFGAVIAAIVAAVNPYSPDIAGGVAGHLMLWPAAVHPVWLAIVAAIAAFCVAAVLLGRAGEKAARKATCPICGLRLAGGEAPATDARQSG